MVPLPREFMKRSDFEFVEVGKEKTVCFSGHRSSKLAASSGKIIKSEYLRRLYSVLQKEIFSAIFDEGCTVFYHGACNGFDLMAADILESHKKRMYWNLNTGINESTEGGLDFNAYPEKLQDVKDTYQKYLIKVIAVVPYTAQAKNWPDDEKIQYEKYLNLADEVVTISPNFRRSIFQERNEYMVDRSSKLISFCSEKTGGTKNTIRYAEKQNLDIINIFDKGYTQKDMQFNASFDDLFGNGFFDS